MRAQLSLQRGLPLQKSHSQVARQARRAAKVPHAKRLEDCACTASQAAACSELDLCPQVACATGTYGSEVTLSTRLAQQLLVCHDPAKHNTPYKPALKALVQSAVEAYSCGWSEDLLREQLEHAAQANPEQVSRLGTADCQASLLCFARLHELHKSALVMRLSHACL